MQNKLSLLLNIVLTIALAVLYYLHFSANSMSAGENIQADMPAANSKSSGSAIYYVNTDTLSTQYELAKELDAKLKKMKGESESRFEKELKKFEKEVIDFQENARWMTQMDVQKKQEELAAKEQELSNLEQDLTAKLMKDQEELNRTLRNKILTHIEVMRKNRNFSYVMGYSAIENNILVANDSLDITKEILAGLNEAYEKEQKQKK